MTPDKCPKCGAALFLVKDENAHFTCRSVLPASGKSFWYQTSICLTRQRDQLDTRVKELESQISSYDSERERIFASAREVDKMCKDLEQKISALTHKNFALWQWVRDAYEEGYWDGHDHKQFDEAINTSEALKRLDGRAEP